MLSKDRCLKKWCSWKTDFQRWFLRRYFLERQPLSIRLYEGLLVILLWFEKKITTVAILNCLLLLAQFSPIQTPSSETFAEFDGQPISHHSLWEKLQRMIPVRNVTWLNQNKLNLSKFPPDVISKSHPKNENGKTFSLISSFMSRTRILYHSDRFLHPYISLNPFLL